MQGKRTRIKSIAALAFLTMLILIGIVHLETVLESPEYKAEQFLAQYGWSVERVEKRSSTLCGAFAGEHAVIPPEDIEQANAAVGFPANMDFLTEKTPMVYLAYPVTHIETQTELFYSGTDPTQDAIVYHTTFYSIYCFFDPDTMELTGAFLYLIDTQYGDDYQQKQIVYPLTLSAEEVAALPK